MGSVTSYARARAESLGMQAKVGIAERADRLVLILAATGLADLFRLLGVDDRVMWLIPIALGAAGRGQHDHGRAADPRRTPSGAGPGTPAE